MVKAGAALKTFDLKMMHVTCFAHGLQRITEVVRSRYKVVDKFIGTMKIIFLEAPDCVPTFDNQYPDLALLQKPVVTR